MVHLFSAVYHYLACGITVILPALGVSIGQGLTSFATVEALTIQPAARSEITRTFIIAMALIETAAILGFIVGLRLALGGSHPEVEHAPFIHYAELGVAAAMGMTGCISGIMSAFPARKACLAVARQPFFTNKIQLLMVITQSLMQTPVILGLIVAMLLQGQLETVTTLTDSFRLIASGVCLGLGSIGPVIGIALLAQEACTTAGINKNIFPKALTFTVISAALIESAIIFSLIISLFLLKPCSHTLYKGYVLLGAGAAMGLGTLGVGISSGRLTAQVCRIIALKPELYAQLSRTSFFSQVLIETSAVYALIISLSLIVL